MHTAMAAMNAPQKIIATPSRKELAAGRISSLGPQEGAKSI